MVQIKKGMKTRLIIVAVLLFFSLLVVLHFSLPVKGEGEPDEDEMPHHEIQRPMQSGSDQHLAPEPNVTDSIFATNNTKVH